MTKLKRVVPAGNKYYPDEFDYVSSYGDTLGQLVAPETTDYGKRALMAQRIGAAKHNYAQAAHEDLKSKLTGYKIDAVDLGRNDPKFKDSPFMQSIFANVKNSHDMAQAMEIYELLKGKKEQQAQTTLAGNMMLDIGGRPPGPSEIALNVADEMEAGEIPLPEEVPWSMNDKLGAFAFLSGKAPGAGSTFTEEDQLNLRASQPQHTATDLARALMIEKTTPGKVNLLEKQGGVQDATTSKIGAEQKQIETMTPLQAALLRGKTSVQLANVEKIIQGMALDEAESMQTQQKLINEGNLAEARKNKVNVEMNSNRKIAAQKLLELKASTALEWAGVEKVISDIGNNDMISAMKSLLILEQTNTEKLQGDVEKQQIERIKVLINNLKAHGKQQQNESDTRVDKTKAQTTQVQVETASDAEESDAKVNLLAQQEQTQIQKTKLEESKDQGQRIENYNLLQSGAKEPGKIKPGTTSKTTSTSKTTDTTDKPDHYDKELAKASAKYVEPLVITLNPGDPDPPGLEIFGNMPIPKEEITLQPTDVRRTVAAHQNGGQSGAEKYLASIGTSPKDAIHFMHRLFNWTDEKRDQYLESLEPKKSFFSGFGF